MTIRPEDKQRDLIYQAERECGLVGVRFQSLPEVQEYVNSVVTSKWWETHIPGVERVLVRDGRGRRSGSGGPTGSIAGALGAYVSNGAIKLPVWTRFQRYVLHELAHIGQPWYSAPHGPEYARTMLSLIFHFMGREDHETLLAAYQAHGVEIG